MTTYVRCKALRHAFDGNTYEEKHPHTHSLVWVAKLECPHCGSVRIDYMTPVHCELISRRYIHPDDYPDMTTMQDAKKLYFSKGLIT